MGLIAKDKHAGKERWEIFAEVVDASQYEQALVAAYFIRNNFDVISNAPRIPKHDGDFKSDGGDLRIRKEGTSRWYRVEVKGRKEVDSSYLMNSPKCKKEGIYVDKKVTFESKKVPPDFYFIVGKDNENALVFDVKRHRDRLTESQFNDIPNGREEPSLSAPPECFFVRRIGVEP